MARNPPPDPPLSEIPSGGVRQRVDQVMAEWQSFASFAELLDALMEASRLGNSKLARCLSAHLGTPVSVGSVRGYRTGERSPPYWLIEALLDTNALHLDPGRTRPADADRPAGDHRIALFAAAGMIEVTPESIREWNRDVLAGHRRLLAVSRRRQRQRWGELMTKLVAFHCQGRRLTHSDIGAKCSSAGDGLFRQPDRLNQLLYRLGVPSEAERLALAAFAGLDEKQTAYIERGISSGTIPLKKRERSPFSAALDELLGKLRAQDIGVKELAEVCASATLPGAVAVAAGDLSVWRYGRAAITLDKLRSLVAGLRRLGADRIADPVTPAVIARLVAACGFAPQDLTDTTHDIIRRIGPATEIKPLLVALRKAADIALTRSEVVSYAKQLGLQPATEAALHSWETPRYAFPTGRQVRDLLRCYNHAIRQKGLPPLSGDETGKVVAVAERQHARWQSMCSTDRIHARRPRRPPALP